VHLQCWVVYGISIDELCPICIWKKEIKVVGCVRNVKYQMQKETRGFN